MVKCLLNDYSDTYTRNKKKQTTYNKNKIIIYIDLILRE